jgi:hypothetical protein
MAIHDNFSIVIFDRKGRVAVIIPARASSLPLSITTTNALKLAKKFETVSEAA